MQGAGAEVGGGFGEGVPVTQTELSFTAPCRVPDASSQCGVALRAMQQGVKLTIWNAMTEYHIGALHQRIRDLRAMGWPVKRAEVKRNGKRVAEFAL